MTSSVIKSITTPDQIALRYSQRFYEFLDSIIELPNVLYIWWKGVSVYTSFGIGDDYPNYT